MRFLLPFLCLALAACLPFELQSPVTVRSPFAPAIVTVAPAPGCRAVTALAAAIVEGRARGQSRREQDVQVVRGHPGTNIHLGLIDSVYDWPRPIRPSGWAELRATTVAAAQAHCANRTGNAALGTILR